MRSPWCLIGAAGLLLSLSHLCTAADPKVEALGRTALVLEEETTVLSLFNLGNPAGAAFLDQTRRVDLAASLNWRLRQADFLTLPGDALTIVDPLGNTLHPLTLYSRKSGTLSSSLDDWGRTGYGGLLWSLADHWMIQVLPQGSGFNLDSSDEGSRTWGADGGGRIRTAWEILPGVAVGAGLGADAGRERLVKDRDWTPVLEELPLDFNAVYDTEFVQTELELGGAWRLQSVFDPEDQMDLGLLCTGERTGLQVLNRSWIDLDGSDFRRTTALPWQAQLQGLYTYHSVMDIALVLGYNNAHWYRGEAPGHLFRALDNLDYEFSFRVRLPMARSDDLRFGVVFNNRGYDHPFPTGRMLSYLPDGLYAQPRVDTLSSSIGIGSAFVPQEGSIVAFEYRLGSSKSRQEGHPELTNDVIADSGFTRFGLGIQYGLLEGLFLRLGYFNDRISYETHYAHPGAGTPARIVNNLENSSWRVGLGLSDGPFSLDLTFITGSVQPSPAGWTMLDTPAEVLSITQDKDTRLQALLGLTWILSQP